MEMVQVLMAPALTGDRDPSITTRILAGYLEKQGTDRTQTKAKDRFKPLNFGGNVKNKNAG